MGYSNDVEDGTNGSRIYLQLSFFFFVVLGNPLCFANPISAQFGFGAPRMFAKLWKKSKPKRASEERMAAKAIWSGVVIAATDNYETVEGNVYFPPSSVNMQYAKPSETHTSCPWKGKASYYTLEVDGKQNKDAAWFYPSPLPAADKIKDYVAFWKGVKIEKGNAAVQ